VKIGKTVLGKEDLQHSGTTNIVLVSCNTLHSYVLQPAGCVGLAEREGLGVGREVSRIRTYIKGEYNTAIYIYIYTNTFIGKREALFILQWKHSYFKEIGITILEKLDLHIRKA
jgi:hypothetical protein